MAVKYKNITVRLTEVNGNALALIAAVSQELKRNASLEASKQFKAECRRATSYEQILQIIMNWVHVT